MHQCWFFIVGVYLVVVPERKAHNFTREKCCGTQTIPSFPYSINPLSSLCKQQSSPWCSAQCCLLFSSSSTRPRNNSHQHDHYLHSTHHCNKQWKTIKKNVHKHYPVIVQQHPLSTPSVTGIKCFWQQLSCSSTHRKAHHTYLSCSFYQLTSRPHTSISDTLPHMTLLWHLHACDRNQFLSKRHPFHIPTLHISSMSYWPFPLLYQIYHTSKYPPFHTIVCKKFTFIQKLNHYLKLSYITTLHKPKFQVFPTL